MLEFFSVDHSSYQKKEELCFIFKSNLNIKNLGQNLNVYSTKKLISNCIMFTNTHIIEMVISVAVDCKSMEIYGKRDSRQGKA